MVGVGGANDLGFEIGEVIEVHRRVEKDFAGKLEQPQIHCPLHRLVIKGTLPFSD